MTMAVRIQRKRIKGWRMPEGAVSVTRPGKFGNPFTTKAYFDSGQQGSEHAAQTICVEAFSAWMQGKKHWAHGIPMPSPPDVSELRGKDLACWCSPGSPCHADVLLEIANSESAVEETKS